MYGNCTHKFIYFKAGAGLAVTSDFLSLVPKKRSALLAFFRTTHSVSSPVKMSQFFKLNKKDFLISQEVFSLAGAGLGVPVADILSAPFTPPTFADAALHGGFS